MGLSKLKDWKFSRFQHFIAILCLHQLLAHTAWFLDEGLVDFWQVLYTFDVNYRTWNIKKIHRKWSNIKMDHLGSRCDIWRYYIWEKDRCTLKWIVYHYSTEITLTATKKILVPITVDQRWLHRKKYNIFSSPKINWPLHFSTKTYWLLNPMGYLLKEFLFRAELLIMALYASSPCGVSSVERFWTTSACNS